MTIFIKNVVGSFIGKSRGSQNNFATIRLVLCICSKFFFQILLLTQLHDQVLHELDQQIPQFAKLSQTDWQQWFVYVVPELAHQTAASLVDNQVMQEMQLKVKKIKKNKNIYSTFQEKKTQNKVLHRS